MNITRKSVSGTGFVLFALLFFGCASTWPAALRREYALPPHPAAPPIAGSIVHDTHSEGVVEAPPAKEHKHSHSTTVAKRKAEPTPQPAPRNPVAAPAATPTASPPTLSELEFRYRKLLQTVKPQGQFDLRYSTLTTEIGRIAAGIRLAKLNNDSSAEALQQLTLDLTQLEHQLQLLKKECGT